MSPTWPPVRVPTLRSPGTRWPLSWTGPAFPPDRRAEPPGPEPFPYGSSGWFPYTNSVEASGQPVGRR